MEERVKEQEPLTRRELTDLEDIEFQCDSSHRITLVCIDDSCMRPAFMCGQDNCAVCDAHLSCLGSVRLKTITHFVADISRKQTELIITLGKIEDMLLNRIKEQATLIDKQMAPFPDSLLKPINEIYRNRKTANFSGHQCKLLAEALKQQSSFASFRKMDQLTKQYKQKVEKITEDLLRLRRKILAQYFGLGGQNRESPKEHSPQNEVTESLPPQLSSRMQSMPKPKVVKSLLEQLTKSEYQFMVSSLPPYKQIKLIFRASQHGFRAKAFHQHCDNIMNTFTILKNQFNKIIAGYSAYTWNAAKNFYVVDSSQSTKQKAFLLSITMKKKFKSTKGSNLIFCYSGYGPVFGQGHDLCIADECHLSQESYANFPTTFNSPQLKYGKETDLKFSGARQDNSFGVEEYEVYQLLI